MPVGRGARTLAVPAPQGCEDDSAPARGAFATDPSDLLVRVHEAQGQVGRHAQSCPHQKKSEHAGPPGAGNPDRELPVRRVVAVEVQVVLVPRPAVHRSGVQRPLVDVREEVHRHAPAGEAGDVDDKLQVRAVQEAVHLVGYAQDPSEHERDHGRAEGRHDRREYAADEVAPPGRDEADEHERHYVDLEGQLGQDDAVVRRGEEEAQDQPVDRARDHACLHERVPVEPVAGLAPVDGPVQAKGRQREHGDEKGYADVAVQQRGGHPGLATENHGVEEAEEEGGEYDDEEEAHANGHLAPLREQTPPQLDVEVLAAARQDPVQVVRSRLVGLALAALGLLGVAGGVLEASPVHVPKPEQVLHKLLLRDRLRGLPARGSHHQLVRDLVVRELDAEAVFEQGREALAVQRARVRTVPVPLVLDVPPDHLPVVSVARFPAPLDRPPAGALLDPGAARPLPLVEQSLRERVGGHPGVLDRHVPREDVHHPIGRVLVGRHLEAQARQIVLGAVCGTDVGRPAALPQQQHVVDEREEAVARLMNDHDDGHAQVRHLLQHLAEQQRARSVQPGGGLVEEEQRGARGELQADVHALALAAAEAGPGDAVAHEAVLLRLELQNLQHVVRDPVEPSDAGAGGVAELRGEADVLAHRHELVHDVVLRHEADDGLQVGHAGLLAVDKDRPRDVPQAPGPQFAAERVEEGGLAGARGPHDG
mmetsp:Transcript_61215/g.182389  ORF Transcript_61215/g.182389 Transcript_61215/m.182389 type:complete len:707 (-) Transcript_61215:491-2611(-)